MLLDQFCYENIKSIYNTDIDHNQKRTSGRVSSIQLKVKMKNSLQEEKQTLKNLLDQRKRLGNKTLLNQRKRERSHEGKYIRYNKTKYKMYPRRYFSK